MSSITESNSPSPSDESCGKNISDVSQEVRKRGAEESLSSDLWKPIALTAIYIYALTLETQGWPKDQSTFSYCSIWVPLAASLVYLTGIFVGTRLMKNREPYSAKNYMFTYNLYQTILNGWCVYSFIVELVRNGYPVWGNTLESTNFKMSFLIWIHYNNKYVELLDTLFMVVRKKNDQLSFLHVYHHVLLIWAWWCVCHFACGGDAYFGAMMNSLIHVVMYSYYLLASLGIPCPWKKYITQMQMGQFVVCFASAVYCIITESYPFWLCMLQVYVMLNMLVLFANFYRKAYSTPRVSPKKIE
jgi:elongation of very long chain fatty acids protein 4